MESTPFQAESTPFEQFAAYTWRLLLHCLQWAEPYTLRRWIVTLIIIVIFYVRFVNLGGFDMVNKVLVLYYMNLLVGFMSPRSQKPNFVRQLPEFHFWLSFTKTICVAFLMTFFQVFDIQASWLVDIAWWVIFCGLYGLFMLRYITFTHVPSATKEQ